MATKPDLSSYSIEELDALIAEATELRDQQAANEIAELEARISKLKSIQAPFQAVGGGGSRPGILVKGAGSRGPATIKYRSLKDPSKTWSGRGATAGWLKDEMAETGKPIEAFLA